MYVHMYICMVQSGVVRCCQSWPISHGPQADLAGAVVSQGTTSLALTCTEYHSVPGLCTVSVRSTYALLVLSRNAVQHAGLYQVGSALGVGTVISARRPQESNLLTINRHSYAAAHTHTGKAG